MADIMKCTNEDCKIKEQCYRHTASDSTLLLYSLFNEKCEENCEYFWSNKKKLDLAIKQD